MVKKLVEAIQKCDLDCASWPEETLKELVRLILNAAKDPSDKALLAPGEPYQVQQKVLVPREEGIQLRRKAWNKIIDAILKGD